MDSMTQDEQRAAILAALGDQVLTRDELESRLMAAGQSEAISEIIPMAAVGKLAVRATAENRRGWFWNWRLVSDDVAYNLNNS